MFTVHSQDKDGILRVRLNSFFQRAAGITIEVDNSKVYLPDHSWTKTFAAGLQKCDFGDARVIEAGVGSGINMAGLMLAPEKPKHFIGVDIAPSAVEASADLAKAYRMNADLLESDLLCAVDADAMKKADFIIGCIPQVPMHKGDIHNERELSDYYEETGAAEDAYGLGLNARLLDQIAVRAPQASVVLNIAGRPGDDRINAMFAQHGFKTKVLHEAVVRQDPGTSLQSLAEIEEQSGLSFHFYSTKNATCEIGAHEAEKLRTHRVDIFHKLYVIQANLG